MAWCVGGHACGWVGVRECVHVSVCWRACVCVYMCVCVHWNVSSALRV